MFGEPSLVSSSRSLPTIYLRSDIIIDQGKTKGEEGEGKKEICILRNIMNSVTRKNLDSRDNAIIQLVSGANLAYEEFLES